ncbi:MAG: helix-turn-helix transcriptional regulator [Candidatus Micrarchaeota archaeon]|nr:helix-turn-helix transcriptional regulator [Candidatus Micrarchaeota archaeon]
MRNPDSVSKVLDIMSTKQRWHIVRCLLMGHNKFNQIKRDCNMSSTALSRTLKYLEYRGLVVRRAEGRENSTEYELTKVGSEFSKVLNEMAKVGKRV